MPQHLKPLSQRKRRNKASTRATLPAEGGRGQAIPELPPRLGAVEWPLAMPPGQYLDRFPNGPNAKLARSVLDERRSWHPSVVRWWQRIWRSPMAAEYLEADEEDLYMLAELRQDFAEARSGAERSRLATEIRLQGLRFGLSPIDRRRLEWEVAKADEAKEKRSRKREKRPDPKKDPRSQIRAMP